MATHDCNNVCDHHTTDITASYRSSNTPNRAPILLLKVGASISHYRINIILALAAFSPYIYIIIIIIINAYNTKGEDI